jgi:hypothetical protein
MEFIRSVSSSLGVGPTIAFVGQNPMSCAIAGIGIATSGWCASSKATKWVSKEIQRDPLPNLATLLRELKQERTGKSAVNFVRAWIEGRVFLGVPTDPTLRAELSNVKQSLLGEAVGHLLSAYYDDLSVLNKERSEWKAMANEEASFYDGATVIVDDKSKDLFLALEANSRWNGEGVALSLLGGDAINQVVQWLENRQTSLREVKVERRRLGEAALSLALTSLLVGAIWLKSHHALPVKNGIL